MVSWKRWAIGLLAMAAGTGAARAADVAQPPPATQPTTRSDFQAEIDELKAELRQTNLSAAAATAQVNELKAEVRELKAQQQAAATQNAAAQNTLARDAAAAREAEQAATVRAVTADAASRSQMFDEGGGVTSGYENRRFFIQSDDGNFVFKPWVHIQVRDVTNERAKSAAGTNNADSLENGLEIRRARFGFDGNMFGKDLTYYIDWATNRQNTTTKYNVSGGAGSVTVTNVVGGEPVLEEAWLKYGFHDTPWYIHAGQIHDPLDHENIVGAKYRAPESSLQGDIFGNTDTFCQGVTLIYDPKDAVRWEAGINHGIRSDNVGFQTPPENGGPTQAYNGGVAGRLEYKVMGANWRDYDQLTAYDDKADLLVFGTGYDYSSGTGNGEPRPGHYYTFSHTLDAQYATTGGLLLYGSYFGRYTEHNIGIPNASTTGVSFGTPGVAGKNTYEPSVMFEAAKLLNKEYEPFARFEYMHLAGTPAGSHNDVTAYSAGFNYYIHGHNLKLTGLITYLPSGIPFADTSDDVLLSNNKAETIFILQIQLLL